MENNTPSGVNLSRCADDFAYFCETCILINEPTKGIAPLKLYDYQKRYIKEIEENRFLIAKKFRQGGFTTVTAIYLLWKAMFNDNTNYLVLSKTDREARWIGEILDGIIERMPDEVRPKFDKCNDHLKRLINGSILTFTTPHAARGRSMDLVFIDEAAFIKNMEIHWKAIWPTVSTGGRAIVLSTINATKELNWFQRTYKSAQTGHNMFHVFKSSYLEHPVYSDLEWAKRTKEILGEEGWAQEVLGKFLGDADDIVFCDDPNQEKELLNKLDPKIAESHSKAEKYNAIIKYKKSKFINLMDENYERVQPRSYQFQVLTKDEIHTIFENEHLYCDVTPIKHPDCDTFQLRTIYDHRDFFIQMAEVFTEWNVVADSYRKEVDRREKKQQEMEDLIHEHLPPDALFLAEISTTKVETEHENQVFGKYDIIAKVMEGDDFPENIQLEFDDESLCVNKVPTIVTTLSVKCCYFGLAELTSHEEAVETTAKMIKEKLKRLFRKPLQLGREENGEESQICE